MQVIGEEGYLPVELVQGVAGDPPAPAAASIANA
jgi:hypothetical protein